MTPSELWLAIMGLERQGETSLRLPPGIHMTPNSENDQGQSVDNIPERDVEG